MVALVAELLHLYVFTKLTDGVDMSACTGIILKHAAGWT
jgi:hypothetical protein